MRKAIFPGILFLVIIGHSYAQSSRDVFGYGNAQRFMNDVNGRPRYIHADYECRREEDLVKIFAYYNSLN